jgi:hypothetical protein
MSNNNKGSVVFYLRGVASTVAMRLASFVLLINPSIPLTVRVESLHGDLQSLDYGATEVTPITLIGSLLSPEELDTLSFEVAIPTGVLN